MENNNKNQQVIKSASLMSLGTFSSRILGFVRDALLAALLSPTAKDAFLVAFRLPNMFRRLLGEGSLSVSFIPVFIEELQKDDEKASAKNLSASIFTLLLLVSSTLCVLGIVFMEPLLSLVLSGEGYQKVEGKLDLTVLLARIMFSYLFLVTTYAYLMAILNALKSFFIPALAPAAFNLIFIVALLSPGEWSGHLATNVAWGVLVGGLVQALMVALLLAKKGLFPRLSFVFSTPMVKTVLRNMIPGMLGLGILQFMSLINVYFASRLQEGSHTFIYLADRILELPQSLVAVSLGVALLPTLSELWSKNQKSEMIKTGQDQLKLLLFLALPSAVGMFVLAKPIVEVLFMRGQFGVFEAHKTMQVVQLYSFLLVASSFVKVMAPSFYAIKNTWVPALSSAICLVIHVVVAHFGTYYFGLQGLVGSTVISGFLNAFLLYLFYQKYIGRFSIFKVLKDLWPLTIALAFMAFVTTQAYITLAIHTAPVLGGNIARILSLLVAILLGVLVYFFVCKLIKVKEAQVFLGAFNSKLKNSSKR